MDYDLVIVGAGPAGLSAAIRFKQLCREHSKEYSVCVLEKGAEVGSHILSGNVFEPRAMDELLPNWRDEGAPLGVPATHDEFWYMTEKKKFRLPTPPQMKNEGNYVLSLSELTRWMGEKAEEVGVEVYAGFSGSDLMFGKDGEVAGVVTGDLGVGKDGGRRENFTPGVEIKGKATLLAEGCRGSLTGTVERKYGLRDECEAQSYGLGVKEVWKIDRSKWRPGFVGHSIGFPLDRGTYGGSFLYHMSDCRVSIGFVVALDYKNPYLSPYEEFQRYKSHPSIRTLLEDGEVLQYGARCLNEGGLQSMPSLEFPGGAIIGCSAGFLNVPKIKGTHTAMKSGMLAAEGAFKGLEFEKQHRVVGYEVALKKSWVTKELYKVRNIRPGFKWGLIPGLVNAAWESYITRGRSPWTLSHRAEDHHGTDPAGKHSKIEYPDHDGKVSFDILTSVALSGTNHDHHERCHLVLKDNEVPIDVNKKIYDGPESRYCPAKVYEYIEDDKSKGGMRLQINAQNCLHCKACDIKDPAQNIEWTTPEGGGGPKYQIT